MAQVSTSALKRQPIKDLTYKSFQSHVWGMYFGLIACLLVPAVIILTLGLGTFKSMKDFVRLRMSLP
jgi:hypothetical protein